MKRMHVKLTFIEPVLGTWPSNQNIAREFIASKSPDAASIEDEVAAIGADAVADKGMTVFPRNDDGQPVLYDYQVKGFFKDACRQEGDRRPDLCGAADDPNPLHGRYPGMPETAACADGAGRAGEPCKQRGDPGRFGL